MVFKARVQEVHVFLLVSVVFGMANARSGTRELNLASSELLQITHAVLVLKLALDNVRPDQKSLIPLAQVRNRTCSGSH